MRRSVTTASGAVLCMMLLICSATCEAADTAKQVVRKVLAQFVEEESSGTVDARQRLVEFSSTRPESTEARGHPSDLTGTVLSLDADPVMIVAKYDIGDVRLRGERASVEVAFETLARSVGEGLPGRRLLRTGAVREMVVYELRKRNGRWRVLDPPVAHVSRTALISYYERAIEGMKRAIQDPRASDAQRHIYEALKSDLTFLQGL